MRPILVVILSAFIALSASSTRSGAMTGNQLLGLCVDGQSLANDAIIAKVACASYIQGVVDLQSLLKVLAVMVGQNHFCLPQGVTAQQLTNVVVQKLRSDPADTHLEGSMIVYRALIEAFPCK